MRSEEFDAFAAVMDDLCAALDRPITDARKRAFWDVLKPFHLHDIKRSAKKWQDTQRKMPAPVDLKPERSTAPPKPVDTGPTMSTWACAANMILLRLAYQDERRGFRSIADYPPAPEKGWGLPLSRPPSATDGVLLERCLTAKADYVRMAEEAEAAGESWDHVEFNRMCREGFEKILGTRSAA